MCTDAPLAPLSKGTHALVSIEITTLEIFLLPKLQVLLVSHFSLYFHCPFDSQQILVMSDCTLTVHQNDFLILQLLPAILTFLLRKKLQLITC